MTSKKSLYREEAIPLVIYQPESQKYVLNEEALEFIQSVPAPIGVVGVAGMYRTGKSYLLNQMLLNRSDGFGIGPTVNPCTKGLWVWGKPLIGQSADGENVNILVIDSEGIGALDEDSTHDSRVFALTVLLSSCFIYNSVGSIDEQAIQNLSLIVNLTKNIQLRASPSQGEEQQQQQKAPQELTIQEREPDYEDYSQHLPAFFWVLRDFSLQLVDADGESLTPKEYLERALASQKGWSESVEQKNRIRRCLREFFTERECFTLVRPLTNEENLQQLEKMAFDELRPEFFEQVISLRKRVLSKMKRKTMWGQSLSGGMYADVVKCYITAINEGAVPNIHSAWTYLSENECQKAQQTAQDAYDQLIKELLYSRLPTTLEELQTYHAQAKRHALGVFRKIAIGDSQKFEEVLWQTIKQRFRLIKHENQKESVRVCQSYIQTEYSAIDRKLKMNEYKSFAEFYSDLQLFQQFYNEQSPNCVAREETLAQFMQRATYDAASYFIRAQSHESDVQRTLQEEQKRRVEQELKEQRDGLSKERQEWRSELERLHSQFAEAEVKASAAQEQLEECKREKTQVEDELRQQLQEEKREQVKEKTVLRFKLAAAEERAKESERQKLIAASEFDKERALLQQKATYFEKAVEEFSVKERSFAEDSKKERDQALRDAQARSELAQRALQNRIAELLEKAAEAEAQAQSDLQRALHELESVHQNEIRTLQERLAQSQGCGTSSTNTTVQVVDNTYNDEEGEDSQGGIEAGSQQQRAKKLQLLLGGVQAQKEALEKRLAQCEEQLRIREDLLQAARSQAQKERALLQQKLEFLEVQNREARQQLDENKRAHEAIMSALQCGQNNERNGSQSLRESQFQDGGSNSSGGSSSVTREALQARVRQLESACKQAVEKGEALAERVHELEMTQSAERQEWERAGEEARVQLDLLRQRISELQRNAESETTRRSTELEERCAIRVRQAEEELEQVKAQTAQDIRDQQGKSEHALAQLKNIYDIERDTLERRIAEERDKWDKKLQRANEEYYDKLRQDQLQYEEEIETLKEELREADATYSQAVAQYDHELALKQQTIDTLEKYIAETKLNLQNMQNSSQSAIENHFAAFANERRQLLDRIEQLGTEIQKKEKEIFGLQQKREMLEGQVQRKDTAIETVKKERDSEKKDLTERLERTKQNLQEAQDVLLNHKMEASKDIALANQKNEFLQRKNEELQKQMDALVSRYEDKLINLKSELLDESRERSEREQTERQQTEAKYEKAKRALKEVESTYNKQLAQLERERAVAVEKLSQLNDTSSRAQSEVAQARAEIVQLRETQQQAQRAWSQEVERWKQANLSVECEKNDLLTAYDRDKALWEGKFQFLEQQKEQAKQDLVDALKKFELTLHHLQRARNNEKDEHESSLSELLSSMEKKYQAQIAEMQESHAKVLQDYEDKLRRVQKELKQLKEHSFVEKFGKATSHILTEKKLAEFLENEKRMLSEIETLKAERDQKHLDFNKHLESEKELLKEKIATLENKYRESDTKRNALLFEIEKEKAKWNLDKDHLLQQKKELEEDRERLAKKAEQLVRENEKLKQDSKLLSAASSSAATKTRQVNLFAQGIQQIVASKKNDSQLDDITNFSQKFIKSPTAQSSAYLSAASAAQINKGKSSTNLLGTQNAEEGDFTPAPSAKRYQ